MMCRSMLVLGACVLLSGGVKAAELPEGGRAMIPDDWLAETRFIPANSPEVAAFEVMAVEGEAFEKAVRVEVVNAVDQGWDVEVVLPVRGSFQEGDVCLLRFWARGSSERSEAGAARLNAHVQLNGPPHSKLKSMTIDAGRDWLQNNIPFEVRERSYGADETAIAIHLGFGVQTVELGGMTLLNFGKDVEVGDLPQNELTYRGRDLDAPWRQAAEERIEKIRKSDLVVKVVDAEGNPIEDAEVSVQMTRHAFGFGAAVNAKLLGMTREQATEMDDGRWQGGDLRRYRAFVEQHFNKVVFENDLKWRPWELSKSNRHETYRKEWTDRALDWCANRNIDVRGHYVLWAPMNSAFNGPLYADYEGKPEELREVLFAHIEEKVPAVGNRVAEWDGVNHIIGWGETYADITGEEVYPEIYARARKAAPDVPMWVNEGVVLPGGSRRAAYERIVRDLIEAGQAPDGIGFMGHFSESSLTPPEELLATFDRFAAIIPALQITELDVTTTDDELQGDYLRDVLIAAYSHPDMVGVVMWGFWEGRHWRPQAALWREDWSMKPSGRAWMDLVKGEWWTQESGETNSDGTFATRGFHGNYEITVSHGGATRTVEATLGKEGQTVKVGLED